MLVVNVDLWSGGFPDRARTIGTLTFANVSNLASTSDYVVTADTDRGEASEFRVEGHARDAGFWRLVAAAAERAALEAEARGALASSPTTTTALDADDSRQVDENRVLLDLGRRQVEEWRAEIRRSQIADYFIAQLDTEHSGS